MKPDKLRPFYLFLLIALLVLGMVSCRGSSTPASVSPAPEKIVDAPSTPSPVPAQISNSPAPISPDPAQDVVSISPPPVSVQSNSFPAMAYSEEQLDLIAFIEQCRKQGQKQQALLALQDLILSANPSGVAFKQELNNLWWEIIADTKNISQEPLTDAEIRDIAAVAYLMHPVVCFFYANTLPLEERFDPMSLWYSTDMWIPMYGRDGWDKSTPNYYPPDHTTEYGYALTQEQVKQFTFDMFGVELFPFYDDYDDGNITFHDGTFEVELTDLVYHDLLVSGYRYLGDDLYYVVLDGDDTSLPGPDEGRTGIIQDFMHLVIRRSDSKWGFTVVAKLHDAYEDTPLLKESWTLPEDMALLVNTPRYPVQ